MTATATLLSKGQSSVLDDEFTIDAFARHTDRPLLLLICANSEDGNPSLSGITDGDVANQWLDSGTTADVANSIGDANILVSALYCLPQHTAANGIAVDFSSAFARVTWFLYELSGVAYNADPSNASDTIIHGAHSESQAVSTRTATITPTAGNLLVGAAQCSNATLPNTLAAAGATATETQDSSDDVMQSIAFTRTAANPTVSSDHAGDMSLLVVEIAAAAENTTRVSTTCPGITQDP